MHLDFKEHLSQQLVYISLLSVDKRPLLPSDDNVMAFTGDLGENRTQYANPWNPLVWSDTTVY